MKHLLFLLLFLPIIATAQREALTDTTYITKVGARFFEINAVTYSDGGPADQTATLLGDSAAMVSRYANQLTNKAFQVSVAAETIIKRKVVAKLIRHLDAVVTALPAASPLRSIQTSIQPAFLSGSWTINNGGSLAVAFSNNGAGVLRYTVSGSVIKNVEVLGPAWIVLKNYPSAPTDTDLFKTGPNKWENIDKTITLKK